MFFIRWKRRTLTSLTFMIRLLKTVTMDDERLTNEAEKQHIFYEQRQHFHRNILKKAWKENKELLGNHM